MRSLAPLLLCLAGACLTQPGTPLLEPTAWVYDPGSDPLPEHRTTQADCDPTGRTVELGGFEIDTDSCPYGVVSQPLLVDVARDQPIDMLFWHNELLAPEPAKGHMLLTIGDAVILDWQMDIPADTVIRDEQIRSPARLRAGDLAVLHVHNHGANVYHLNQVTIGEAQ